MKNGKKLCEVLKRVRKQIADKYELKYEPGKCNNKGNCIGTCPQCDAELEDLQRQLDAKDIYDVALDEIISREIEQFTSKQIGKRKKWFKFNPFTLEGMPLLSPEDDSQESKDSPAR